MTIIPIQYQPGTQKNPQQTELSQPCFIDTDHVHFPNGKLSTIPPYASASLDGVGSISGVVRSIHGQKITGSQVGTMFFYGSETGVWCEKNGVLYNITPFADQSVTVLGTNPLAFAAGSATMTVTHTAHGLATGDVIVISGATEPDCVAAGYINTTHVITVTGTNTYTVTLGTSATHTHAADGGSNVRVLSMTPSITLGTNAIAATSGSKNLVITSNSHGLLAGARIKIAGVTSSIGGIAATNINAEFELQSVTTNTFTITQATSASSSATGGTGAKICTAIASGNTDQGAASGFGAGVFGDGVFGAGQTSTIAQKFPRIWSFAAYGSNTVMCPGDYTAGDGQKIYLWDGDTDIAPTVLLDAPTDCNWVNVLNNQIVALCGNTIKINGIGDTTGEDWTGLGIYTAQMQRVWKLISMTNFGDKVALIHTPNEHILLRYVGGQDKWDVTDLFLEDGLLAPKASTVVDSVIYMMGFRGIYGFDGSFVKKLDNQQNEDWIVANINTAQHWKSFACPDTLNAQAYFHFPTSAEDEPSDYVIVNPAGHYTLGQMSRTAAQNAMIDTKFYMADSSDIYRHFTSSAVTFDWYAQSSFGQPDDSDIKRFVVNKFIPDANQAGTVTLEIFAKEYPQADETSFGTTSFTGSTQHVTTRAAGKMFSWKLSGSVQYVMGKCGIGLNTQ